MPASLTLRGGGGAGGSLQTLPLISPPEVFGLHDNANIAKELQETHQLLDSLMLTQSRDAGGGGGTGATTDEVIATTSADILSRLPPNFDIEKASNQYPVSYLESMNTGALRAALRIRAHLLLAFCTQHVLEAWLLRVLGF
ncbi:hypothetical protein CYMTET_54465 [Cymbomonas tetramitiformis]|uniref:Dynein heavy chain C-terminal domain-containing protein n=1 Tax=Cymbomonas tetramitiformis TaxID=36881 RepID=A0AAE0BF58_9CHLO|nr:hypothetical protein CYMTET_54465 [Cymbomonas tetramitiformis]